MNHITTVAIVGLGSRGKDAYAQALKAMPDKARITAIADTDPAKGSGAGIFRPGGPLFRFR